jgi:hypothetical protein
MDWELVFDEAYPRPGASDAILAQFVAEVARPLSADEVWRANTGQTNPFRRDDPFYSAWRPFDAAGWVVPGRPLPPAYLSLLRWSNGGEFRTGERWFQFFPALDPCHGVRAMLLAYNVPERMPGALPVAFNGAGTFYLLDMRRPAVGREYPVVCAHASYKSWNPEACLVVADSFLAACRGTVNVDHLRSGRAEPGAVDGGV